MFRAGRWTLGAATWVTPMRPMARFKLQVLGWSSAASLRRRRGLQPGGPPAAPAPPAQTCSPRTPEYVEAPQLRRRREGRRLSLGGRLPMLEDTTPPGSSANCWSAARSPATARGSMNWPPTLCCASAGTTRADAVLEPGGRWRNATEPRTTGLDHYQVRRCRRWYRHITLGHVRTPAGRHGGDRPKSPGSGLVHLTLGEVSAVSSVTPDHHHPPRAAAWAWSQAGAAATSTALRPVTTSEDPRRRSAAGVLVLQRHLRDPLRSCWDYKMHGTMGDMGPVCWSAQGTAGWLELCALCGTK